jgi:hypothetical protein
LKRLAPLLLSVGDHIAPGAYRFHSRFARAINFQRQGRLLSLVSEDIGPGPLNIVVRRLSNLEETAPPSRKAFPALRITATTVALGNQHFPFTRRQRYHSSLDAEPRDLRLFDHNLTAFGKVLKQTALSNSLAFLLDGPSDESRSGFERAVARQMRCGVRQVFQGRLLEGVRKLKGCGPGLTPSGDDFIAGLLFGLNVLQKLHCQELRATADAIFKAARGNNIFSNTFLDLARQGLFFGRMKDLVLGLMSGNGAVVRKATAKLLAIGASSGADLATGFLLTVRDPRRSLRLQVARAGSTISKVVPSPGRLCAVTVP